jgi:hypothetical protein
MEKQKQRLQKQQEELKKQQAFYDNLRKNLAKDKLINISGDYEFKLSTTELVINGVKQPHNLFEKYKKLCESLIGKKLEKTVKFQYNGKRLRVGN